MYTEKYLQDNIIPMIIVSQANQIGIEQRKAMRKVALEFGAVENNTRIVQVLHSEDICNITWKIQKVLSDGNRITEVYDNREKAELAYGRALLEMREAKEILYADDKPIETYIENDKFLRTNCINCGASLSGRRKCKYCGTYHND